MTDDWNYSMLSPQSSSTAASELRRLSRPAAAGRRIKGRQFCAPPRAGSRQSLWQSLRQMVHSCGRV